MYKKLKALMKEEELILITSPYNMRYFSGFTGGEGAVLISKKEKVLLTDSRYTEAAQKEAEDFFVIETTNKENEISEFVKRNNIKEVLIEEDFLNVGAYLKLKEALGKISVTPFSQKLNELRTVKTEEEIEYIKKAELICCRSFEKILERIKPGLSEKEVAAELEYYLRLEGGEGTSFETIVVSGKRSSLPHGTPTEKKIEKGDFVTLDFGCMFKGYSSDMTRTVVVGKASDEQKKVYDVVREAQKVGIHAIYEGACASEADAKAREVIEKNGYGKYFGHALGHGVGLMIHELPTLSPKSEVILKENMVVSCEPGIYIPDFGGVRIEDLVCVKKVKCLNLTPATKELIEL